MAYPVIEWIHEGEMDIVTMNGCRIVELFQERRLAFTSCAGDERWIGKHKRTADLGWGVQDSRLVDYRSDGVEFENHPEEGWFQITARGGKNVMECRNDSSFRGVWHEEEGAFHYFLTKDFESKLEELYQHSTNCLNSYAADPAAPVSIEVINNFVSHISFLDIFLTDHYPFPRPLYPWFVMSEEGKNWVKSPMVHIYTGNRPDLQYDPEKEKDLIAYPLRYGKPGACFGWADDEYGGWLIKPLETSAPIRFGICWMFFDVHTVLYEAIPPRYSCEDIHLHYACEYVPISAEQAASITKTAREYNWREGDLYDVPVFSMNNRFDDSLRTLPGDKVSQLNYWYQSDRYCRMDHTLGYDDSDSVMIERTENKPIPSAWHCRNWGPCYDLKQNIGRRYRMRAMVKTENCTGKARIGKVSMGWGGDLWHGCNTHYEDGEPKPRGGHFAGMEYELDLNWAFSPSVTGTQDWKEVSLEFDVLDGVVDVFLEMSGTGKCWFDNVVIEDIGVAEWIREVKDFRKNVYPHEDKFLEHWKDYDLRNG